MMSPAGQISVTATAAFVLLGIVALGMWGCPQYMVYQQGLTGQAELRRAEQNRQIRVQEAQAREDSAKHNKAAEITQAEGHAAAVHIIGEALTKNPDYLRYMWVNAISDKESPTVIYVPTEAQLPILEAGRRGPTK